MLSRSFGKFCIAAKMYSRIPVATFCTAPPSKKKVAAPAFRKESDTFGELEVPADKYWGA